MQAWHPVRFSASLLFLAPYHLLHLRGPRDLSCSGASTVGVCVCACVCVCMCVCVCVCVFVHTCMLFSALLDQPVLYTFCLFMYTFVPISNLLISSLFSCMCLRAYVPTLSGAFLICFYSSVCLSVCLSVDLPGMVFSSEPLAWELDG